MSKFEDEEGNTLYACNGKCMLPNCNQEEEGQELPDETDRHMFACE
jgi:hypothetical protein